MRTPLLTLRGRAGSRAEIIGMLLYSEQGYDSAAAICWILLTISQVSR